MESYEHMNMFERSNIVTVHERISNVSEAELVCIRKLKHIEIRTI